MSDSESSCSSCEDDYEHLPYSLVAPPAHYVLMTNTAPLSPRRLLQLRTADQEISGRVLWTGSVLLARWLVLLGADGIRDRKILELGCGVGVVSVTAARLAGGTGVEGGPVVACTDGDEKTVGLVSKNLAQNAVSAVAGRLLWGDADPSFDGRCRSTWPAAFGADAAPAFDVILAGDVLYKSHLPALFFETVRRYLAPGGMLALCHVPRNGVEHDMVVRAIGEAGLEMKEGDAAGQYGGLFAGHGVEKMGGDFSGAELPEECPIEDAVRARIYIVRRKATSAEEDP